MSQIQRIRSLMMITEQEQRPVTAPVNTEGLLKVIQLTLSKNKDVIFDDLSPRNRFLDNVYTNLRLLGIKNVTENEVDDYVFTFIKDNASLLDGGDFDPEKYIIPTKKKFEWDGVEKYWAWTADYYTGEIEAYSEVFVQNLFDEFELMVSDGQFIENEVYDTKDTEQQVDSIKEIPFNKENVSEQVDLSDYNAPFTSEDFVNYVNSEFDIEMLEIMKGVIDKRLKELNTLVYMANRKEIKGFRK